MAKKSGKEPALLQEILDAINHGTLPREELESRLEALIDAEAERTDRPADMELVTACEELLMMLHGEKPEHYQQMTRRICQRIIHRERKRKPIILILQWGMVVAAAALLFVGAYNIHWYSYSFCPTPNEQQQEYVRSIEYLIPRPQAEAAFVESEYIRTESLQELDQWLGFASCLPSFPGSDWQLQFAEAGRGMAPLHVSAMYRNADWQTMSINVEYFHGKDLVEYEFEQSYEGRMVHMGGHDVYVTMNVEHNMLICLKANMLVYITSREPQEELLPIMIRILDQIPRERY